MATVSLFHKKNDNIKRVRIFENKIPEKTDLWCWWCCHPFDTIPVSSPTSYDKGSDSFELSGNFCSLACCKAHTIQSSYSNKTIILANLKIMAKRLGLKYTDRIMPAPPRQALKVFGGYLTIEEFREKSKGMIAVNVLTSNQIIGTQYIEEKPSTTAISISGQHSIDFTSHEENKKETFSLKRNKPLKKKKGTLEAAMGLTIK